MDSLLGLCQDGCNIARRTWRLVDEVLFARLTDLDPAIDRLTATWVELLTYVQSTALGDGTIQAKGRVWGLLRR